MKIHTEHFTNILYAQERVENVRMLTLKTNVGMIQCWERKWWWARAVKEKCGWWMENKAEAWWKRPAKVKDFWKVYYVTSISRKIYLLFRLVFSSSKFIASCFWFLIFCFSFCRIYSFWNWFNMCCYMNFNQVRQICVKSWIREVSQSSLVNALSEVNIRVSGSIIGFYSISGLFEGFYPISGLFEEFYHISGLIVGPYVWLISGDIIPNEDCQMQYSCKCSLSWRSFLSWIGASSSHYQYM